jgi:hypothetical protein
VRLWCPFQRRKPLNEQHWRHARWLGIPVLVDPPPAEGTELWIDALFGNGQTRAPGPEIEAQPLHRKNSPASPTPVLADGRVYVHFGHHGTACLDRDGRVLWRNNEVRYDPVHGNGGSPVLAGDLQHDGIVLRGADGRPAIVPRRGGQRSNAFRGGLQRRSAWVTSLRFSTHPTQSFASRRPDER